MIHNLTSDLLHEIIKAKLENRTYKFVTSSERSWILKNPFDQTKIVLQFF